jgi:ankyrin repeat protein
MLMTVYNRVVTDQQVQDYDHALLHAVRSNDVHQLRILRGAGKCMSACNKWSESVLHMACRRSTTEVVAFLVGHGASLEASDDYGRTPMHDACWRADPDFEMISFVLQHNRDLLRYVDNRGSTPLDYIHEVQWPAWCAYLLRIADSYWPVSPQS